MYARVQFFAADHVLCTTPIPSAFLPTIIYLHILILPLQTPTHKVGRRHTQISPYSRVSYSFAHDTLSWNVTASTRSGPLVSLQPSWNPPLSAMRWKKGNKSKHTRDIPAMPSQRKGSSTPRYLDVPTIDGTSQPIEPLEGAVGEFGVKPVKDCISGSTRNCGKVGRQPDEKNTPAKEARRMDKQRSSTEEVDEAFNREQISCKTNTIQEKIVDPNRADGNTHGGGKVNRARCRVPRYICGPCSSIDGPRLALLVCTYVLSRKRGTRRNAEVRISFRHFRHIVSYEADVEYQSVAPQGKDTSITSRFENTDDCEQHLRVCVS